MLGGWLEDLGGIACGVGPLLAFKMLSFNAAPIRAAIPRSSG